MLLLQGSTNIFLLIISLIGISFNRKSILIILMCLEVIFLSLNINFAMFSVYFDDIYGQLFSLFILTVAASESAIGLAIIIVYYRVRGTISLNQKSLLRL